MSIQDFVAGLLHGAAGYTPIKGKVLAPVVRRRVTEPVGRAMVDVLTDTSWRIVKNPVVLLIVGTVLLGAFLKGRK